MRPSSLVMCNTPVEVQFTSAGCLNYPCRTSKVSSSLRHIPVIMISALDEIDSVVRCIELGAEDYLPKPFNPTLLRARVGACLERKRLYDEVAARTRDLSESLQQQTATSDVLGVISSSPSDLEPVFQAMLQNAVRLCEAKFAFLFRS